MSSFPNWLVLMANQHVSTWLESFSKQRIIVVYWARLLGYEVSVHVGRDQAEEQCPCTDGWKWNSSSVRRPTSEAILWHLISQDQSCENCFLGWDNQRMDWFQVLCCLLELTRLVSINHSFLVYWGELQNSLFLTYSTALENSKLLGKCINSSYVRGSDFSRVVLKCDP